MTIRTRAAVLRVVVGCWGAVALALACFPAVASADLTATEGQSFSGAVSPSGGCAFQAASVDWGDGTPSSDGGLTQDGTGFTGIHTYVEEGVYNGTVTYTCPNVRVPQHQAFTATVQDAALTGAGLDSAGAAGRSLSAAVAHVDDANPAAGADDFSAQIDWGDGTTSVGTVSAAAGGGFDVTGAHTYDTAANFTVRATITDVGGSSTSASSTARVAPTALAPPSATVSTPPDGASYSRDEVAKASYSCSPGSGGALRPGVAGCSGPVPSGAPIDTTTPGGHTFVVIATDTDGQRATATSHYTVLGPPPPPPIHTTITSGPQDGSTVYAPPLGIPPRFTFVSSEHGSRFECNLRTSRQVLLAFTACSSPYEPQGLVSGATYVFTVRAIGPTGNVDRTPAIRSFHFLASPLVPGDVDVRVTGIEVTQGIQARSCVCAGTLPSRDQANLKTPGQAAYQGVRMAAGHFTVVRVFANFTQPAGLSSLQGATARLEVLDSNGRRISLLSPDTAPAALTRPGCGACVSLSERASMGASFNFLVPWQETEHRLLSFRATVSPPTGLTAPRQCSGCRANTFLLSGVPFVSTATVPVYPIPLTVAGARTSKSEIQVFGSAQTVLPGNVQIHPYDVPLAVDNMNTVQAMAAVLHRASDNGLTGSDFPIGVFIDGTANLGGGTVTGPKLYDENGPYSIVRDDRPLTSAMHEIGHGLGLVHASNECGGGQDNDSDDYALDSNGNVILDGNGNPTSNGQTGEPWPPDEQGQIQGVGLDRRNWNIYRTGSLPGTLVEGFLAAANRYFDFMSYCANTNESTSNGNRPDAWISALNWNRLLDFHPPTQALPAAADIRARAASGASLRVIATVDPAGKTSIFDVAPGQRTTAGPTAGSPFRIELRDAAGSLLTSVVPATIRVHVDGRRSATLLEATLPFAAATASVVVSADGRELTRRARSAHAPTASVLSPRRGSHIGRAATTLVRWTAHDADGDRLTATVDYSPDGGRHWKVLAGNLRGSSVRLPSRALSASRNARLRIRVSDGFDVTTATSGRLFAAGAPPRVRIIGGFRGGRVRADATLLLQGAAFDDAGRLVTGPHLKWYAGRRLLGRGERLTVRGLPASTRAIRLLATDTHGRTSQASLHVKVLAVPPAFLLARAPTRVAARAHRVRIVVASTVPAVLTIAGVRHTVDRRARKITIVVRPGRSALRLRYSLSSRGGVARGTYVAAR